MFCNKNLMDILNRSGRIPNIDDELNLIQHQKKQYTSIIDLSIDEVDKVIPIYDNCMLIHIAGSVSSCHETSACGRTRFP